MEKNGGNSTIRDMTSGKTDHTVYDSHVSRKHLSAIL